MPGSALPRVTRLFLAGNAVAMTGNGLVIAFTLIYLHQARGIALPVVGLLLAAGAAAGLLAVTVSGVLLDRLGARRVLTGILLGQATAQVLLAWALQRGTAVLTTPKTPSRARENFAIPDLPEDAMQEINAIQTRQRFNPVTSTGIGGFVAKGN